MATDNNILAKAQRNINSQHQRQDREIYGLRNTECTLLGASLPCAILLLGTWQS